MDAIVSQSNPLGDELLVAEYRIAPLPSRN
jgi:hypothetical protein